MIIENTNAALSNITGAIRDAARATGASFDYLLKTALRESNLDPAAKSATSSATGLFQFVDQTWLETLKWAGPQLGYGQFANDVVQTPSGQMIVPDQERRREIMALRNDPAASAAMAAAFTQRNAAFLGEKLGRAPSEGELYMAHFLGGAGSAQLISAAGTTPNARAADLFPDAAQANRAIFFERNGAARSVAQVYDVLAARHERGATAVPQPGAHGTAASASVAGPPPSSPLQLPLFPGEASARRPKSAPDAGPVFHSLFQSDGRGPVSSFVSELWGSPNTQRSGRSAVSSPSGAKPLELFRSAGPDAMASRGGN